MLTCLKEFIVINLQIKVYMSWVETSQTDRDAAQMRLRLDGQRYGNERRIHVLNSDVLDEAQRAERLKDKCENKYSLYCVDVISTFDCALCVLVYVVCPS